MREGRDFLVCGLEHGVVEVGVNVGVGVWCMGFWTVMS